MGLTFEERKPTPEAANNALWEDDKGNVYLLIYDDMPCSAHGRCRLTSLTGLHQAGEYRSLAEATEGLHRARPLTITWT